VTPTATLVLLVPTASSMPESPGVYASKARVLLPPEAVWGRLPPEGSRNAGHMRHGRPPGSDSAAGGWLV
jgi:hypothetical protein